MAVFYHAMFTNFGDLSFDPIEELERALLPRLRLSDEEAQPRWPMWPALAAKEPLVGQR